MMVSKISRFFLLVLGLIFILIFLYMRLIMVRLPKDITFEYNIILILLYLWLVFIYFYKTGAFIFIQYMYLNLLLKNPKAISTTPFWQLIFNFLTKPLNIVYEEILNFNQTKNFFFFFSQKNFLIFNKHYYFIRMYHMPYVIFNLLPRIIVLCALFYDIWHLYFYYFYKTLMLLLIPLIYQMIIRKSYDYYMIFLNDILTNSFLFIPISALTFNNADAFLYSNDLNFEFHKSLPESFKKKSFLDFGYMIYKFTLFNHLYLNLEEEDLNIQLINKLINYIFAMLWWYLLFNMLLNMPPLTFDFLHLLFDYSFKILF